MAPKAAEKLSRGDETIDFESEMAPAELARLRLSVATSDAQHERGEGMPASVLLEDFDRILAEG